ncbi:MAG: DNA-processing protein DprA [Acidobacteriota bacterium]
MPVLDLPPSVGWLALSILPTAPAGLARALAAAHQDPAGALRILAGPEAGRIRERACRLNGLIPGMGLTALTREDQAFPALLRTIPDPPPVLYLRGTLLDEDDPAVAVVGSRRATLYGTAVARYLGQELGAGGLTVVSGLAHGIDAAAHQGALMASRGRGIAVLGHGLDRIYPAGNRELAQALAQRGALVSEFPPGTPPRPGNFPRRNRLISGLSRAVVVVEAAPGSGSLITARLALDQGREIFAVPGPITAPTSQGANDLIRQGAQPATGALDIVQNFPAALRDKVARRLARPRKEAPPDLSRPEREIWDALDASVPQDSDQLAARTGLAVTDLVSSLVGLEIRELIRALPGGRYIRKDWTGGDGSLY